MRVLISGGGTGGHVYPALAVVDQLRAAAVARPAAIEQAAGAAQQPAAAASGQPADPADAAILWIGGINGMEKALVERAGVEYAGISTGQITGISPIKAAGNLGRIGRGIRQSLRILRRFQPEVCLATGGYVCAPMVTACRMTGVPVLIYLPDMTPGSAIKSLSRLATRVAVSFPEVASFFGGEAPAGKAVVTGYPVRRDLIEAAGDRAGSRAALAAMLKRPFAGEDEPPLVLIWGGSQGARSINYATWHGLAQMLPAAHIVHVVGNRDWPLYEEYRAANPLTEYASRYHPVAYLHEEMPLALAAADLTVARAGASSLGEFPVAHLPSVLVPLPHAGVNQSANAELLAARGAAVVVEDARLEDDLAATVTGLLADPAGLEAMTTAAAGLARPDAAAAIAAALQELVRA